MLRAPFTVRALSHTRDLVKIAWGDGAQSKITSTWFRANVRDGRFFEQNSILYRNEHLPFVAEGSPITSVEETGGGHFTVNWEDHSSTFDSSWVRASDVAASASLLKPFEPVLWDSQASIPTYDYSLKDEQLESWLLDLKKRGIIFVEKTPTEEKALRSFLNTIGALQDRLHPVNVFTAVTDAKAMEVDYYSYGPEYLDGHTDSTYYTQPPKLLALLSTQYSAPKMDTVSFFVDAFKVAEDLRRDDPEAFHMMTTTPVRQARRRLDVEEECPPEKRKTYQVDTFKDVPIITMDGDKVSLIRLKFTKHGGFNLLMNLDDAHMKKFYRAYEKFQKKINDSANHQALVLKPGMMAVIDNQRVCHGRYNIHPSTARTLLGGYISEDQWRSRWRVIFGERSGLESRWLYGCSDETLEILANRYENNQ